MFHPHRCFSPKGKITMKRARLACLCHFPFSRQSCVIHLHIITQHAWDHLTPNHNSMNFSITDQAGGGRIARNLFAQYSGNCLVLVSWTTVGNGTASWGRQKQPVTAGKKIKSTWILPKFFLKKNSANCYRGIWMKVASTELPVPVEKYKEEDIIGLQGME